MSKTLDLTGQKFTRLLAIKPSVDERGARVWCCKCDCGKMVKVKANDLTRGNNKSCGCLHAEIMQTGSTIHGYWNHSLQKTFHGMMHRCYNEKDPNYRLYGARGISVCDEWHDIKTFCDWGIANGWKKGLQLDRIDNNGNYEPLNCRFVTKSQNQRNKRNNRYLTYKGKTKTMVEWAEIAGISYQTMKSRINKGGWSIERAMETPIRKRG